MALSCAKFEPQVVRPLSLTYGCDDALSILAVREQAAWKQSRGAAAPGARSSPGRALPVTIPQWTTGKTTAFLRQSAPDDPRTPTHDLQQTQTAADSRCRRASARDAHHRGLAEARGPHAGDRLAAERELALELGVSRPSLREAIKQLVSRGLLLSRHGGGTFVTDRLTTSFNDPWQQLLAQHPFLHDDVLEFRHLLEASTASLAAQRATDSDLERLEQAYLRLDAAYAGSDRSAQVAADVAFHLTIAESAHNAVFAHLLASILRLLHEHVRHTLQEMSVSEETGRSRPARPRLPAGRPRRTSTMSGSG